MFSQINMFPHSCTVYHKNGDDTYTKYILEGVYWYGPVLLTLNGKGIDSSQSTTVIVPIKVAKKAIIKNGDYVVKGLGEDIKSVSDLDEKETVTIKSIGTNDVGRDLDSVVLSCV